MPPLWGNQILPPPVKGGWEGVLNSESVNKTPLRPPLTGGNVVVDASLSLSMTSCLVCTNQYKYQTLCILFTMQNFDARLFDFFQTHNLQGDYHEHPPVFTVDECQDIKKTIPGFHTKNLFLTDKKWWFYLVSIEADKRFPVNLFRKALGLKDLSFWSPEQLFEFLQLTPWSVSLFGLIHAPTSLNVFLDHDLRHASHVWRHPNRNDATVVIDHATLERFLSLTWHLPRLVKFDEASVQLT